jgi:hypothetical protein
MISGMFKLASGTIGTVKFLMEALAKLGLIIFGNICLEIEFLNTMSEGAGFLEGALASELPVLA